VSNIAILVAFRLIFGSWLYAQFIGMDCNFKMTRKNVSSDEKDPSLCNGFAYFVPEAPFKEYLREFQGEPQEVCLNIFTAHAFTNTVFSPAPASPMML
jgi:hypothetical protein